MYHLGLSLCNDKQHYCAHFMITSVVVGQNKFTFHNYIVDDLELEQTRLMKGSPHSSCINNHHNNLIILCNTILIRSNPVYR